MTEQAMTEQMITEETVWQCEQWLGGQVKQKTVFRSEESARDFVRRLSGVSPDLMFKVEPMPIQHVWN
jgi:hypothetical protein